METDWNIKCLQCNKSLSVYDSASDSHTPSPEVLLLQGKVPVPNAGWFCSQKCGNEFGKENKIQFQRDKSGKICYY